MGRRKWILSIVSIIVICVAILVVIYIMSSGPVINGFCHGTVSLQSPVSTGENVWRIEIVDVDMKHTCPPNLEYFVVAVAPNGTAISASYSLQSGLVAYDPIVIFFADYGKIGGLDAGDLIYLVNLETESAYDFYIMAGWGPPATVTIHT